MARSRRRGVSPTCQQICHMLNLANVTKPGYAITAVHLTLKAKIPGADQATFEKLSSVAKAGCPVSKLMKADITLDATLIT